MHKVKFIEKTHQYLTEDDRELISVSAFTERFKEKIDWKAKAKNSAARMTKEGNPITGKELLAKWENKRVKSAEVGTIYHAIREQELINSECSTQQCDYVGSDKWSIPINKLENDTTYPELMIYDFDYMICGQSDKVIVKDNTIHIWDYKTDNEIKFKGWSSKWKSASKMLKPLQHLEECNGNIYSIKMSIYMYLLWKANKGKLKVGDIVIEHVHLERDPNNDDIPILIDGKPVVKKIELIKLPYRKKEVEAMLSTLKK